VITPFRPGTVVSANIQTHRFAHQIRKTGTMMTLAVGVGVTYRSHKTADYYFGIDESEASEQYPVFEATSAIAYVSEVGVTYPLSEKWVFRSFIRRMDIGAPAKHSPLILDDHGEVIASAISYVF